MSRSATPTPPARGSPAQAGVSAGCQRSSRSYPALVAQGLRLNADQVRDVSCSGATIADLSAPQPTSDGTNPAQLTALSAATTLVTPGIGGNDIDWAAEKIQTAAGHLAGAPNAAGAWPSRTWIFGSSAAVRRSRHPRNDPGTPMRPNGTAAGKATPIPATPRTRSVPPASGGVTHSGAE